MGPMRAACRFSAGLKARGLLSGVARVEAELYGSLALTGKGHATDSAVLLGLEANDPATINPAAITPAIERIRHEKKIALAGERVIEFVEARDLRFLQEAMTPPGAKSSHPNGLRLRALDTAGLVVEERIYFSIGGGFITEDGEESISATTVPVPFPFHSAQELLQVAANNELTISQLMFENECAMAPRESTLSPAGFVRAGMERLWQTMQECIERGMLAEGTLPGGLNVQRRARRMAERLQTREAEKHGPSVLAPLDWLTVWAMAVNEENAAGGRVVTAPTNGAAGVVPAVAQYYQRFSAGADEDGIERFFLTSAAIGILYKENASISGAEVGCQGEVGVACSMAAAGLTAAMGGSNGEVEHAAEIAMEHNLGMTCDPIGGLVQIPCIERNAMAAAKAIHAARIAMNEGPEHKVTLDQVIRTMYLTGMDMQARYKETSLAGLALNRIEC
jgi:L-serine dehydratase